MLRFFGRGVFKLVALFGAIALLAALWIFIPGALVGVADANLFVIKMICEWFPSGIGYRAESALRIFGIDHALLLVEAAAFVKLIMLAIAWLFRPSKKEAEHV